MAERVEMRRVWPSPESQRVRGRVHRGSREKGRRKSARVRGKGSPRSKGVILLIIEAWSGGGGMKSHGSWWDMEVRGCGGVCAWRVAAEGGVLRGPRGMSLHTKAPKSPWWTAKNG